jgi:glycosyltransferase involved in cell wall biosynthesis
MFDYSGSPDFYKRSFLYRLATSLALRFSSISIFISNDQYISITSHLHVGFPQTLHSSLPLEYDPQPFLDCDGFVDCSEQSSATFLFFSWLTIDQITRKSLFIVLDAFCLYVNRCDKNAKLIIGGKSANAVPLIKDRVESLGLSGNVIFCLDVDQKKKNQLYMRSDLLIAPSFMEGFGNATLEAMSFGCPALVSSYGASSEVVGDAGFVIHSIDQESIFKKLHLYHLMNHRERLELRKFALNFAFKKFNFANRLAKFTSMVS